MDYGNILRRSWDVIWNHKFMLVLGFLAALGSGASGGGGGGGGGDTGYTFDGSEFEAMPEIAENLGAIIAAASAIILGLVCFFFILAIVLWLVRLTAQAGMIDAAARLDAGEKVSFGEAISAGWHKLGRMVGLNLVLFGIFILAAIVGVMVLVMGAGATAAGAAASQGDFGAVLGGLGAGLIGLICCLMCLFLLLGIVVTVLYPFAQRAAVLEDMGVIESIGRGWQVIKDNLGEVIILILLFLLLGFVVGAVTLAIFIPVAALAFAPIALRFFGSETIEVMDVVLASGGLLCMILVGAAINAIYVAFRSTAVTLAYGEFTSKKPVTGVAE
ncbi:MAG: hypothetical protein GWP61_00535 [Chloroflexi bacterium]|jgi:hypothetical protein|nr:hypothetical protein [Chloroflexota bacterium]